MLDTEAGFTEVISQMEKEEKNQGSYWGTTLESFLEEEGMLDKANAYADERIQAWKDKNQTHENS